MDRRHPAAALALAGMVIGALLLIIVAVSDDPPPTVAPASDAVDAAAYAATVTSLCTDRMAAAEAAGYEASAAGAQGLDELAAAIAELPPPVGGEVMAQALVDGIDHYAGLFARRDENLEQFSQEQNELSGVLEVRAAGLGAGCGEQSSLAVAVPADAEDVAEVDDPALQAAAGHCFDGDLAACDQLLGSGTALGSYGTTCGGRLVHEEAAETIGCVESFAGSRPVGNQP